MRLPRVMYLVTALLFICGRAASVEISRRTLSFVNRSITEMSGETLAELFGWSGFCEDVEKSAGLNISSVFTAIGTPGSTAIFENIGVVTDWGIPEGDRLVSMVNGLAAVAAVGKRSYKGNDFRGAVWKRDAESDTMAAYREMAIQKYSVISHSTKELLNVIKQQLESAKTNGVDTSAPDFTFDLNDEQVATLESKLNATEKDLGDMESASEAIVTNEGEVHTKLTAEQTTTKEQLKKAESELDIASKKVEKYTKDAIKADSEFQVARCEELMARRDLDWAYAAAAKGHCKLKKRFITKFFADLGDGVIDAFTTVVNVGVHTATTIGDGVIKGMEMIGDPFVQAAEDIAKLAGFCGTSSLQLMRIDQAKKKQTEKERECKTALSDKQSATAETEKASGEKKSFEAKAHQLNASLAKLTLQVNTSRDILAELKPQHAQISSTAIEFKKASKKIKLQLMLVVKESLLKAMIKIGEKILAHPEILVGEDERLVKNVVEELNALQ